VSPRILKVDPGAPEPSVIDEALHVLRAGGLVAFPTETVYGLGARALDPLAVARIFHAKGRPSTHPVIAHVLGEDEAKGLTDRWGPSASAFARAFWPGPLTLVVGRVPHVPPSLGGGTETIGIRAPRHAVARALLSALGEPIAAPSANRYQALSPTLAEHVTASLGDRVDLVLDGGPCLEGLESTVLDARGDVPRVLRPGTIDLAALRRVDVRVVDASESRVPEEVERASPGLDARHYAPRASLRLAKTRAEALAEAERRDAEGETVGVILRGPGPSPAGSPARTLSAVLPDNPSGYGRELYATLHGLDRRGATSIVVEAVPTSDAWRAVADRLARGSTR